MATGRSGGMPCMWGATLRSQELRMECLEVFQFFYDFLFAQQPFLLAKLNPQLLQGAKYSTTGWALTGLYDSRAFSRHRPSIYRHLRASRSIAGPFTWVPLVARERREVHVGPEWVGARS
jgi:hypothetical protein